MMPLGAVLPWSTSPIPCSIPASAMMAPKVEANIFVAFLISTSPFSYELPRNEDTKIHEYYGLIFVSLGAFALWWLTSLRGLQNASNIWRYNGLKFYRQAASPGPDGIPIAQVAGRYLPEGGEEFPGEV